MRRLTACCFALAILAGSTAPGLRAQDGIIFVGDVWKFFRGVEEPPPDWNTVDFDDSLWEEGASGFGYGDGDDNTLLDDMQNGYLSVYIRRAIDVPDPTTYKFLELGMQWDDGFVAYLNGVEIARMQMTGTPPPYNATAQDHENTMVTQWFPINESLRAGKNVIAIQGHNTNLTSSDFSLIPELRGYTDISPLCPTQVDCTVRNETDVRLVWRNPVNPAPYTLVEIRRDGEVIGTATNPMLSRSFLDSDVAPGDHTYEVLAHVGPEPCSGAGVPSCTVTVVGAGGVFRRGDSDVNGAVNLTDAVFILRALFEGSVMLACSDAADADDSGVVNLTDAVFLLQALFLAGSPQPPPPGLDECGPDPTDDAEVDCDYTSC